MPPPQAIDFCSYIEAREFVRSLKLNSSVEYRKWAAGKLPGAPARPQHVPANPHRTYAKEWRGFADWLGTERVANFDRKFLPYEQAQAFVAFLRLETYQQWRDYCAGHIPRLGERPAHIPSNPNVAYKNSGWCGIRHWLGVGGPNDQGVSIMLPFEEARAFARSLGLSGLQDWREYVAGKMPNLPRRPKNVPSNPDARYKHEGWSGYGDFLGTGNVAYHRKRMQPFAEARQFARSLEFKTSLQWRAWAKTPARPPHIPSNPEKTFSTQWRGWRDWLRAPS